jgi:hypothetical protein
MSMSEADYVAGNPSFNGTDRLVVVSGCSGGGKSTLLVEMMRRGYQVYPEPGRQIVKEQLHLDKMTGRPNAIYNLHLAPKFLIGCRKCAAVKRLVDAENAGPA